MSKSNKDEVEEAEQASRDSSNDFRRLVGKMEGLTLAGTRGPSVVPHIWLSIRVCSFFSLISEAGRSRIWRDSGAVEEIPVSSSSSGRNGTN